MQHDETPLHWALERGARKGKWEVAEYLGWDVERGELKCLDESTVGFYVMALDEMAMDEVALSHDHETEKKDLRNSTLSALRTSTLKF